MFIVTWRASLGDPRRQLQRPWRTFWHGGLSDTSESVQDPTKGTSIRVGRSLEFALEEDCFKSRLSKDLLHECTIFKENCCSHPSPKQFYTLHSHTCRGQSKRRRLTGVHLLAPNLANALPLECTCWMTCSSWNNQLLRSWFPRCHVLVDSTFIRAAYLLALRPAPPCAVVRDSSSLVHVDQASWWSENVRSQNSLDIPAGGHESLH